jgi:hypothetical protein
VSKDSNALVEAQVTRVYNDSEDGVPYFDVRLENGSVRQTVAGRLLKCM